MANMLLDNEDPNAWRKKAAQIEAKLWNRTLGLKNSSVKVNKINSTDSRKILFTLELHEEFLGFIKSDSFNNQYDFIVPIVKFPNSSFCSACIMLVFYRRNN